MKPPKEEILQKLKKGISFHYLSLQTNTPLSTDKELILHTQILQEKLIFNAEIITDSTPLKFKEAINRIKDKTTPGEPLIISPYLGEDRLEELRKHNINGVDLCGNGIVILNNEKIYIYKTGKPNLYPDSRKIKHTYQGTTSLIGRTFLLKEDFDGQSEIKKFIEKKGGKISISTISKALNRLEEDIIVKKNNKKISLLQKDKLIENLAKHFVYPQSSKIRSYSLNGSLSDLLKKNSAQSKVVASGKSSISQYATMGRDESFLLYTQNADEFYSKNKDYLQESERFSDLIITEVKDPTAYFDIRTKNHIPYASPIQTYLECANGDKREQETAEEIKELILKGKNN